MTLSRSDAIDKPEDQTVLETIDYLKNKDANIQMAQIQLSGDLYSFKASVSAPGERALYGYCSGPHSVRALALLEAFERFVALKHGKSSIGCALHSNPDNAKAAARAELIERHVITNAWIKQARPKSVAFEFDSDVRVQMLREHGFEILAHSFGQFADLQISSIIILNEKERAMSFGAAARATFAESLAKAFKESFTIWSMDFFAQKGNSDALFDFTQRKIFSSEENWSQMREYFALNSSNVPTHASEIEVKFTDLSSLEQLKNVYIFRAESPELEPLKLPNFYPFAI